MGLVEEENGYGPGTVKLNVGSTASLKLEGIKPLSGLEATGPVDSKGHSLMEKSFTPSLANPTERALEMNATSSQKDVITRKKDEEMGPTDAVLAVADAVNIEKEIADRSNSKVVYVNLMFQELLHTDQTTPSLLSDSPPNSPFHQMEETNDDNELSRSRTGGEELEPDNVFEMDSRLEELDIYGDFEYDLEDEYFIGASALKRFQLQVEESKIKVVFSTIKTNRSNKILDLEDQEKTTVVEVPKVSLCMRVWY
ncbi:hypothetical protein Acr_09g0007690 [Actinidia rufa]|uniref:Uncharacterized protein n=1 Tax=Actinidia rufa TaxID=165716 RepID=A0A7J0F6T7_9ERIC|nr:hypothetical protein Acr_09g0007690 [Actinidia rufa]